MRKEILFAIIAGGTFGLAIAFGAWRLNSSLKKSTIPITSSSSPTPISQNNNSSEFKIILESPQDLQVLTDTPTTVSGITNPNSWVAISGADNDEIVSASDSGKFSANIDLEGGENQIVLIAFDKDGNSANANLDVIFSSQFVKDAGNSGMPVAYIGTVTDISNSIIQIKNDGGDIQQITGATNASYVDTRNDNVKTIKASDVAIGDYLVAMGYKDGNNILNSSRILVTETPTSTNRTAIFGEVSDASGYNKFVMKDKNGDSVTVTPATGINVNGAETKFGDIKNKEKLIVSGVLRDGTIDARAIQVLE